MDRLDRIIMCEHGSLEGAVGRQPCRAAAVDCKQTNAVSWMQCSCRVVLLLLLFSAQCCLLYTSDAADE